MSTSAAAVSISAIDSQESISQCDEMMMSVECCAHAHRCFSFILTLITVASLLTLAMQDSTAASSSTSPPRFIRRGLHNTHNTCFLNCVLQCLLHCQEFWNMCCRLSEKIEQVDEELKKIDETTSSSSSLSTSSMRGVQLPHSHTRHSAIAKVIPITHELLTFAAHFRRKPNEKQQTSNDADDTAKPTSAAFTVEPSAAPTATEAILANSQSAASSPINIANPITAVVAIESPSAALTSLLIESSPTSSSTSSSPSKPASSSTPSSTTNASKKPRKKPSGVDKDLAFLESIAPIAATPESIAEEEEKRRAKNKKKKEKEREKMKEKAAMAEQATQPAEVEAKENTASDPIAPSAPSPTDAISIETSTPTEPVATEPAAPMNARQRRLLKKQQQAAALTTAPAAAETHEENGAEADEHADSTPITSPSSSNLGVPKKQARVHRVEDEEDFTLPVTKVSKKAATTPASSKSKSSASTPSSTSSTTAASPSTSASSSSSSLTSLPTIGPLTTTSPFLPNFTSLLHAFKSHHLGQQEDAQELLHILCDSVQTEWTKWNQEKTNGSASAASSSTSQSTSEDSWSEVGKGSRAIRVVSNLSFASSPLSRLFCGRIRSQLTIANRSTDTMSYQPFYAIHLDIDEEIPTIDYDLPVKKKRASKKTKPMSISRAFDRYMNPISIIGYRKQGSSNTNTTSSARHIHALDSHSLPKILVIHLKRFEQILVGNGNTTKLVKSSKHVQFTSTLNLPPRYLGASDTIASSTSANVHDTSYTLVGIVVHHGHSMSGGHYTSYVRDRELELKEEKNGMNKKVAKNEKSNVHQNAQSKTKPHAAHAQPLRSSFDDDSSDDDDSDDRSHQSTNSTPESLNREIWYHCDDSRVTPVPSHIVYAQAAYLLFYTLDAQGI